MNNERHLATIRKIDAIDPIPDADKIEVVTVGGWKVVAQKGIYNVGDLAVYCEIDSWIPTTVAPFLTKDGHYPKVYNGVEGERLKTIKLRGQISQGLLLPISILDGDDNELIRTVIAGTHDPDGIDVTEALGIQKWEKEVPACLAGTAKGNFPIQIPKTDQERIQNLTKYIDLWSKECPWWEITEKLDGSSMTVYLMNGEFGVCSRNWNLKETESNAFWKVAREQDLENKIWSFFGDNVALQGELVGPGVQKNRYGLDKLCFFLFDIFNIKEGRRLNSFERVDFAVRYGIDHVPIICRDAILISDIQDLLLSSEGPSSLNNKTEREGIVYKSINNPDISFKVISNKFLLKNGE